VPKLLEATGPNVCVQAGGGVHGHPEGTKAGARALRAAVEAAVLDEPLEVRAQESAELGAALEKWGTETPR
jgi:ribulose-bisphosphate carboxylase large chain